MIVGPTKVIPAFFSAVLSASDSRVLQEHTNRGGVWGWGPLGGRGAALVALVKPMKTVALLFKAACSHC
jgi:hypothetical protein